MHQANLPVFETQGKLPYNEGMIIIYVALSLTLGLQKPNVSSPPAPAFKTFLATLPPDLKFLEQWPKYKISELHSRKQQVGQKPVSTWYYQYEFISGRYPEHDVTIPQKWARHLKQNLTAAKGWKLEFPEEGTYNANAVRTLKGGTPDWSLQFRSSYGRSYVRVYDLSKPFKTQ